MSSRERPARLAPLKPADPADDWRFLAGGVSDGGQDDLVSVRLEIRGDLLALRYSVEINGRWHRREQALDNTFARFIRSVRRREAKASSAAEVGGQP